MTPRYPRLLDQNMQEICRPIPVSVSITESLRPLSSATVGIEQGIAQVGQFMELYTIHGSVGIYRIEQIETEHNGIDTLHLQHGLVTLADTLQTGSGEKTGTPAEMLSMLLAGQSLWRMGTVEATKNVTWSWDYSSILEGVEALLDALPGYRLTFDQRGAQWTLNLVALDNTDYCEVRLSRNVSSLQMETDRSELCTRLYVPGHDAPMDADTINKWGVVARRLDADPELGQEAINQLAAEYLEKHKNPKISMTINASDWFQKTGEKLDHFAIGRMCQVCLPGQVIRQRITGLDIDGFEPVTVTLENETTGAESAIASLIVDTTEIRKRVKTEFERVDERIIAAEDIIKLISTEIEMMAKRITANAEQIQLKASAEVVDSMVRKDSLISEINLSPGTATISANKIALNGEVIANLINGSRIDVYSVDADEGDFSMLYVAGSGPAQWLTKKVLTGQPQVNPTKRTIRFVNANGQIETAQVITELDVKCASSSVNYLGAE